MDIDKKIAILVDGDNAQAKSLEPILTEVAKYGKATVRRIYGDWTTPNMQSWKALINGLSFQPIQQFAYTTGKNSTDGALIIDAMDILHSKSVEGFCIVSSDSDFTRLAARIREAGVLVIGIGKKTTPKAFIQSCEQFIFVENILPTDTEAMPVRDTETSKTTKKTTSKAPALKAEKKGKDKAKKSKAEKSDEILNDKTEDKQELPIELLKKAFASVANESEEAYIASFGSAIRRLEPSFDHRTYGYSTFSKLLHAANIFEIKDNKIGDVNHPIIKLK